jgi:hypothetical protein
MPAEDQKKLDRDKFTGNEQYGDDDRENENPWAKKFDHLEVYSV